MKNIVTPIVLALLLLVAGAVFWTLGEAHDRLAQVATQVMTMEYDAVADDEEPVDPSLGYAERVPILGSEVGQEVRDDKASASYWLGRYDALTLQRDSGGTLVERDPQLLLLAANAAYRANPVVPTDRQGSIERLETIVTYYAEVVKSSPELFDAAYNYEYTSRLRTSLEGGGRAPVPADAKHRPEIHGLPGGPPKGVEPNKFNIIVPKSGDERTDSPEAGQGQKRIRKG